MTFTEIAMENPRKPLFRLGPSIPWQTVNVITRPGFFQWISPINQSDRGKLVGEIIWKIWKKCGKFIWKILWPRKIMRNSDFPIRKWWFSHWKCGKFDGEWWNLGKTHRTCKELFGNDTTVWKRENVREPTKMWLQNYPLVISYIAIENCHL